MASNCWRCETTLKAVFIEDDWRVNWRQYPLIDEETGSKIGRVRHVCETCEPNWFNESASITKRAELQGHKEESLLFMNPKTQQATGLVTFFGDLWQGSALFLGPETLEWQIATNSDSFQRLLKPLLENADQTWALRLFIRNVDPAEIDDSKPGLAFESLIKLVSQRGLISADFLNEHADLQLPGTYQPEWFDKAMMNFDADVQAPKSGLGMNSVIAYKWTESDELARALRLKEALNPPKLRKTCEWCRRQKKEVAYSTSFLEAPKNMIALSWARNRYSPDTLCVYCAGLKPRKSSAREAAAKNESASTVKHKNADWQKNFEDADYLTKAEANKLRLPTIGIISQGQKLPELVWGIFLQNLDRDERDAFIQSLWEAGWTHRAISDASDISHERVRQIILQPRIAANTLPVPDAPKKQTKAEIVFIEPSPADLQRLLELQPLAQQVRANSPKFRNEAEEYTKLLAKVHLQDNVTLYRLAKRLGVTHGALRFRLARYGYMQSEGKSKSYKKVLKENRAVHKL